MKFVRQLILILAFVAAFICLSVFSTVEYPVDNTNLNATEDKLPLVKTFLANLDAVLSLADKAPFKMLPTVQTENDYETKIIKTAFDQVNSKNNPDISEKKPKLIFNGNNDFLKEINPDDLFNRIKKALAKDWFRS